MSVMKFICGNSLYVKAVDCFCRGPPSLMFDGILHVTLSEEKISTTGVTQGNLKLLLRPNSPDSQKHKYKKMKYWTYPTSSLP